MTAHSHGAMEGHCACGAVRYRMLESIRQFSRDHLLEAGESNTLRDRHASYYVGLSKVFREKFITSEYLIYLKQAKTEMDNFRGVLTWTLEEKPEIALELIATLIIHNAFLITPQEVLSWTRPALEKTRPLFENNAENLNQSEESG